MLTVLPYRRTGISAAKIVLIGFLALVMICGGVGIWLANVWRGWVAYGVDTAVRDMLTSIHLADDQHQRIETAVHDLMEQFQAKQVTTTQLSDIVKQVAEGQLFGLIQLRMLKAQFERDAGKAAPMASAFDRFARGVVEGKISAEQLEAALKPMRITEGDEQGTLRKDITLEEFRTNAESLAQAADQAGIPDEPFMPDFAGMVEQVIQEVTGITPSSRPATPAVPATIPAI